MKSYAGIGSKEVPDWVYRAMVQTAQWLARKNYTLRSGGADGSDTAFEEGCDLAYGDKEIFLPWKNFNNNRSKYIVNNLKAFDIAEKYHPAFYRLSQGAKKLQARNSHQVLGWDLESPCNFIICYTKNGSGAGGTGQALRIAEDYNIPIFDFGCYKTVEEARIAFNNFWNSVK